MELRTTEDKIGKVKVAYEAIRSSPVWRAEEVAAFPPVPAPPPPPPPQQPAAPAVEPGLGPNQPPGIAIQSQTPPPVQSADPTVPTAAPLTSPPLDTLASLVDRIQSTEKSLQDLALTISKFRKRLGEVDPVTEKPRYGPKAQQRVERMVQLYNFFCQRFLHHDETATATGSEGDQGDQQRSTIHSRTILEQLQQQHQTKEEELQRQKEAEDQARFAAQREKERLLDLERREQEASMAQQAREAAAQRRMEDERLRRLAQEARQQRRSQEEARRQVEQEWLDSILKGPEGVRHYIQVLKEATQDDAPAVQATAIQALSTIFEQINRHPEEVNFRKIRKNHPKFHEDIGRHNGGVEILIAAGFRPTLLATSASGDASAAANGTGSTNSTNNNGDGDINSEPMIACLISKEPNLEQDMDGWSAWYDLNKATLAILQEEVKKLSKR